MGHHSQKAYARQRVYEGVPALGVFPSKHCIGSSLGEKHFLSIFWFQSRVGSWQNVLLQNLFLLAALAGSIWGLYMLTIYLLTHS